MWDGLVIEKAQESDDSLVARQAKHSISFDENLTQQAQTVHPTRKEDFAKSEKWNDPHGDNILAQIQRRLGLITLMTKKVFR